MSSKRLMPRTAGLLIAACIWTSGCVEQAATDAPRVPSQNATDLTGRPAPDTTPATATAGDLVELVTPSSSGCRTPNDAAAWAAEVLRLTNEARLAIGVDPVEWSAPLASQAEEYACEMIDLDFFAHVNPETGSTLRDRADSFSYEYWAIGENLAGGQTTPAQVVREWLESPSHRENLLNPAYTELGVGVRIGGEYRIYWVQEFGRPLAEGPFRN